MDTLKTNVYTCASQILKLTTNDRTSRPRSITFAGSLNCGCIWCILIALITDKTSSGTSSGIIVVSHCGCV